MSAPLTQATSRQPAASFARAYAAANCVVPKPCSPVSRVNHRYLRVSAIQLRQQVGPGPETKRLRRDITDDDLVICRLRR